MKLNKVFVIILLLTIYISISRNLTASNPELKSYEDSLVFYFDLLRAETNDEYKLKINNKILHCFREALENEESFYYPFFELKYVGMISSDDEKLRMITWNLPYSDHTHKYFGFIQYKKNRRSYQVYELNDKSPDIKNPELAILSNKKWYGALYYQIITNKYKGAEYYTLLGADLNDLLTKKKIIEILYFDQNNEPVFGKQVFKNKSYPVSRVIFEFNGQINMTLTFDKEKEMIVFDHLSPSRPSLKGQYEFYGPDFSYDGLKFERGIWNSYTDIDVRDDNIQ